MRIARLWWSDDRRTSIGRAIHLSAPLAPGGTTCNEVKGGAPHRPHLAVIGGGVCGASGLRRNRGIVGARLLSAQGRWAPIGRASFMSAPLAPGGTTCNEVKGGAPHRPQVPALRGGVGR